MQELLFYRTSVGEAGGRCVLSLFSRSLGPVWSERRSNLLYNYFIEAGSERLVEADYHVHRSQQMCDLYQSRNQIPQSHM